MWLVSVYLDIHLKFAVEVYVRNYEHNGLIYKTNNKKITKICLFSANFVTEKQ